MSVTNCKLIIIHIMPIPSGVVISQSITEGTIMVGDGVTEGVEVLVALQNGEGVTDKVETWLGMGAADNIGVVAIKIPVGFGMGVIEGEGVGEPDAVKDGDAVTDAITSLVKDVIVTGADGVRAIVGVTVSRTEVTVTVDKYILPAA